MNSSHARAGRATVHACAETVWYGHSGQSAARAVVLRGCSFDADACCIAVLFSSGIGGYVGVLPNRTDRQLPTPSSLQLYRRSTAAHSTAYHIGAFGWLDAFGISLLLQHRLSLGGQDALSTP